MADWIEADARTVKGNWSHAKRTYNDYKIRIKVDRNNTKLWEQIS